MTTSQPSLFDTEQPHPQPTVEDIAEALHDAHLTPVPRDQVILIWECAPAARAHWGHWSGGETLDRTAAHLHARLYGLPPGAHPDACCRDYPHKAGRPRPPLADPVPDGTGAIIAAALHSQPGTPDEQARHVIAALRAAGWTITADPQATLRHYTKETPR